MHYIGWALNPFNFHSCRYAWTGHFSESLLMGFYVTAELTLLMPWQWSLDDGAWFNFRAKRQALKRSTERIEHASLHLLDTTAPSIANRISRTSCDSHSPGTTPQRTDQHPIDVLSNNEYISWRERRVNQVIATHRMLRYSIWNDSMWRGWHAVQNGVVLGERVRRGRQSNRNTASRFFREYEDIYRRLASGRSSSLHGIAALVDEARNAGLRPNCTVSRWPSIDNFRQQLLIGRQRDWHKTTRSGGSYSGVQQSSD